MSCIELFEMTPKLAQDTQVVGWVFERNLQDFHLHIRMPLGDGCCGFFADLRCFRSGEQIHPVKRTLGHDREDWASAHFASRGREGEGVVETSECEERFQNQDWLIEASRKLGVNDEC